MRMCILCLHWIHLGCWFIGWCFHRSHLLKVFVVDRIFVSSLHSRWLLGWRLGIGGGDGVILEEEVGHMVGILGQSHQFNHSVASSMKSPKNRDLLNHLVLKMQLSPQNKARTLSRMKASNEGCIRRQNVLSPDLKDSSFQPEPTKLTRWQSSFINISTKGCHTCASPTLKNSRVTFQQDYVAAKPITTQTSTQQNASGKLYNDDILQRITLNQRQSDQIDKLKKQLTKSYSKLKQVQRMHQQTEQKTLKLESAKTQLQNEIRLLKQQRNRKDDIIFQLERRVEQLVAQNESLHAKISELQMGIVEERSKAITNLKQQLLSLETRQEESVESEGPLASFPQIRDRNQRMASISSNPMNPNDSKLLSRIEELQGELRQRRKAYQQQEEKLKYERNYLAEQLQQLELQMQALKQVNSVNPNEYRKQRQRQQIYLLYAQALSLEALLKQQV